jgi:glutaredoxin 3
MAKVEIYTKFLCPYCTRAKALLTGKGVAFEEHDISMGGPLRAEMLERAGGRNTVPQIFIDGRHIVWRELVGGFLMGFHRSCEVMSEATKPACLVEEGSGGGARNKPKY